MYVYEQEREQVHYFDDAERALRRYRVTEDWVNRRLSNLDYLMLLNTCVHVL